MAKDPYQETINTWNKVAALYEEKFMGLSNYDGTYEHLCKLMPKDATVLEVGCGPGNIGRFLLSKYPELRMEGCDVAANMVERAQKNNPQANYFVMDARELHLLRKRYQAIVLGFCIPYLSGSDCEKLISDTVTLLEPGGILYLSFVEGDPNHSGYMAGSTGDRTYFYCHQLATLKTHLQQNQFEIIEVADIPYTKAQGNIETHCVVLAKKV